MYELTIYKPTNKQNGSAVRLNTKRKYSFLKIAPQNAPKEEKKVFDWENAINVKMNLNDIGWFKAVLRGSVNDINAGKGLFHKTETDSKSIRLERVPDRGFRLVVNQKPKDGELRSMGMNLSYAESENLLDFLTLASEEMLYSSYKRDV
jgi:hypothetical protein